MNETTKRNSLIKQRLCKVFNRKDVMVRGERGTAYGWVSIKVEIDRPTGCTCNWITDKRTWGGVEHTQIYRGQLSPQYMGENGSTYMCPKCLAVRIEAEKKVKETIFSKDIEYGHYCADDGYNTERAEVLYDVNVR